MKAVARSSHDTVNCLVSLKGGALHTKPRLLGLVVSLGGQGASLSLIFFICNSG